MKIGVITESIGGFREIGYFAALGLKPLEGREFAVTDGEKTIAAMLAGQTLGWGNIDDLARRWIKIRVQKSPSDVV